MMRSSRLQQANNQMSMARRSQKMKIQETLHAQSHLIRSSKSDSRRLQEEMKGVLPAIGKKNSLDQCIGQEQLTITGLQKVINTKIGRDKKPAPVDAVLNRTVQPCQFNKRTSTTLSNNVQLKEDIETMRGEEKKVLKLPKLGKALQETNLQCDREHQQIRNWIVITEKIKVQTSCEESGSLLPSSKQHATLMGPPVVQTAGDKFWAGTEGVRRGRRLRPSTVSQDRKQEKQERLTQLSPTVLQLNPQKPAAGPTLMGPPVFQSAENKFWEGTEGVRRGRRLRHSTVPQGHKQEEQERLTQLSSTVLQQNPQKPAEGPTLIGPPVFQTAENKFWQGTEGVRRGRRLRHSTTSQGLKQEEQERLTQLSSTVLQQNPQEPAACPDLDQACKVLIERESLNFSLFRCVLEQIRQIEDMTRDVQELRMKIKKEQERKNAEHRHLQDTQPQEKKDDKRVFTSISEILSSITFPDMDISTSETMDDEEEVKPLSREEIMKKLLEM